MLNRLTSNETSVSNAAKDDIDVYLEQRQRRQREEEERKKMTAGCKTTASKTVINNKVRQKTSLSMVLTMIGTWR